MGRMKHRRCEAFLPERSERAVGLEAFVGPDSAVGNREKSGMAVAFASQGRA